MAIPPNRFSRGQKPPFSGGHPRKPGSTIRAYRKDSNTLPSNEGVRIVPGAKHPAMPYGRPTHSMSQRKTLHSLVQTHAKKAHPHGNPQSVAPARRIPTPKKMSRGNQSRMPRKAPSMIQVATEVPMLPRTNPDTIRVIPLGGVEEIGRNMTAVEYMDDIIVIDAGIEFSDEDTPGVDYLVPNTKYLEANKDRIRAVVITHGHLDHIGALPYIMEKIGNPPIYTREFGALLIKKKAEEFPQLPPMDIKIVEKDDGAIALSPNLKVRFFGLTHSIPDSTGVIIETPLGDIISTGDVRVDNINGIPSEIEVEQYKMFKDRNILLMTMDSTGITAPGWSVSEKEVLDTIDTIVGQVSGRLIIATFASQVERILEFINIAKKYNKYIVIEGRSMITNIGIAEHLQLTDFSHVIPVTEMDNYPPHKVIIISTGGQGEEFSALMRMSNNTHRAIKLQESDTIILSSSVIPGNEGAIDNLKDNLYRSNVKVITYVDNVVHASGHGKRAELEWIHKQIPYKFFMPVHGHHHRLKMHAELAQSLGVDKDHTIVPDNGSVVEFYDGGTKVRKLDVKVPSAPITVEGGKASEIQEVVMRDRKLLSEEGMFVLVVTLNQKTRTLKKSPDIISRGFIYLRENQELLSGARILIKKTAEEVAAKQQMLDTDEIKNVLAFRLQKYLLQHTAKNPIVIPVVIAV